MSIFDRLKQNNSDVQPAKPVSYGCKKEIFTFNALPESLSGLQVIISSI